DMGDRNVHSVEDAKGYIARGPAASYAKNGFGLWAVELRPDHERVGMCGLIRRESLPHPDLGFAFLARHQRRGYASEAAAAVVALARTRYRLPRLLAITEPDNAASQTVLERLGFQREPDFAWAETGTVQALFARSLE